MIELINCDCMSYMANQPDNSFDLAIVDPPYFKGVAKSSFYGAKVSSTNVKRLCSDSKHWDKNIPNSDYFNELLRISRNHIVWGCNYYPYQNMPVGRVVWDKKNDSSTFSNCELASISLIDSVKIFRYEWNGMLQGDMKNKENRIHPTQKPVKLYEWLLTNYAEKGQRILDTHGGSMSSAIACHYFGCDMVLCEIDEDYYKSGCERFDSETRQVSMF